MRVEQTPLKDCFIIHDTVFKDERGYFFESFNKRKFAEQTGIEIEFVQDNQSRSVRGVLRGLHFQKGNASQAKLVRVIEGSVYDIAVDLRKDSPTFGQWFGLELSSDENKQFFIPKGFAHGFLVLSDTATFFYKCDNFYDPSSEVGIRYDDPTLNIEWPIVRSELIISQKDINNISFAEAQMTML